MIHVDTHVVVWLYAGDVERFTPAVRARLEAEDLKISPIVQLELDYLHEIRRISTDGASIVVDLTKRVGLSIDETPFLHAVTRAGKLAWTRDPFDRMIVGQALAAGVKLLTRDASIRKHTRAAIWGLVRTPAAQLEA